jgi:hypothetical protein
MSRFSDFLWVVTQKAGPFSSAQRSQSCGSLWVRMIRFPPVWVRANPLRQRATRKLQESYRQAYIYSAINDGKIARCSKQVD